MVSIRKEEKRIKKSTFWGLLRTWPGSLVICRPPSQQRCSSLELSLQCEKNPDRLSRQKLTFQIFPDISTTEISELDAHGAIQEYILRFDISMYHPSSMQILNGVDQLSSIIFCTFERYGAQSLHQNL